MLKRVKKPLTMKHCTSIIDGLKAIYFNKVGADSGVWGEGGGALGCMGCKPASRQVMQFFKALCCLLLQSTLGISILHYSGPFNAAAGATGL